LNKRDIDNYRELKISSMTSRELVVFLYESALGLMEEAREKIAAGDVPGTHEKLDRCRNIFLHLLATLNLEGGGELAYNLSALYAFFVEKITLANVTKNTKELDDIVPLVTDIKEAWAAIGCNDEIPNSSETQMAEPVQAFSVEA
jgi:flagellar protein FliS